ncbi:phage regulatory protein [Staphylococcus aureus]|nr:phage regulatory protein [Staphylococcus aureus]
MGKASYDIKPGTFKYIESVNRLHLIGQIL